MSAHAFPATGQTQCWDTAGTAIPCAGTGQDGAIRAGAALSYTDNGDGTITDNNTGLMWEKKSVDDSIHDVNTVYTWDNAFAVHIAGLNASGGFAGHTDWRLPNVKELQSIVDYELTIPAVSPAFETGDVWNRNLHSADLQLHRAGLLLVVEYLRQRPVQGLGRGLRPRPRRELRPRQQRGPQEQHPRRARGAGRLVIDSLTL